MKNTTRDDQAGAYSGDAGKTSQREYTAQQTLLLLDGHSMAFRAYYALRPDNFRTASGQYTNAVHGFINTLLRMIKQYRPTHIAVAFDLPGGTFRTREYAEYKGGRKPTPEEFKGQISIIQEVLSVLGIAWLTYEDYEADDIVATLATHAEAAGMRVYLASGDKDSYQLVTDAVTVLYPMPRSQMLEMTPEAVEAKTGVRPQQYSDIAALIGEGADNIPGVPGVGPKTAVKWINKYGSLASLLEHADEIKNKAGQSLRDHREQVLLNRRINQLVLDLPLSVLTQVSMRAKVKETDVTDTGNNSETDEENSRVAESSKAEGQSLAESCSCAAEGGNASQNPHAGTMAALIPQGVDVLSMHTLFDALEFQSVRNRVLEELPRRSAQMQTAAFPADGSSSGAAAAGVAENFAGSSEDTQRDEENACANIRQARIIQADLMSFANFLAQNDGPYGVAVTGDATPGYGHVSEFAVAAQSGHTYVAQRNMLTKADDAALAAWLADSQSRKIGHGTKGMSHAWRGSGYDIAGIVADTELEAYLLNPDQRSYTVSSLALRYLSADITEPRPAQNQGEQGALALDLGASAEQCVQENHQADELLGEYALAILNLHDALEAELAHRTGSERLASLEIDVTTTLSRMEERGIAVDFSKLQCLESDFAGRVAQAERIAREAADEPKLNLKSPKQLQEVLFENMQLPHTKKTKRGYTTNAEALVWLLNNIAHKEDDDSLRGQKFLTALLEHRDAIKLLQSVEGLEKAVQSDGRIHTTYQQTVTATGRLSSAEPNLQNIHARTEEGLHIREVFVPGEGFDLLMTADYSQIEMRLMAHLSDDTELIEAFNQGADLHKYVASRVFGIDEDSVTPAQRSRIKAMSYGLVYGLSAYGLSSQLHISVYDAQELMDGYFSRFGRVKNYLDGLVAQARRDGYTETIMGRRRYLPDLSSTNQQLRDAAERMALNAPIQGSAADIIKIAMVSTEYAMRDAGLTSRILLQVHDELVLEVVEEEAEQVREIVEKEMGSAWPELSVPLTVGVGIGKSWREAAH